MGSVSSTGSAGHGGACLQSQHSEGWGKRIEVWDLYLITQRIWDSLNYLKPCLKTNKKTKTKTKHTHKTQNKHTYTHTKPKTNQKQNRHVKWLKKERGLVGGVYIWQFTRDSFTETCCKENKPDTDKSVQAREWEWARSLEQTAKGSTRPSRAIQAEGERNQT